MYVTNTKINAMGIAQEEKLTSSKKDCLMVASCWRKTLLSSIVASDF